ncbi:hypothetical protein [Glaciihabitans sp. dw_435]|uniref:hypothetical protein n=1 Tax=Glaciihabitans sp. dw_435 TaxID=2720081 RepID=UPI001BD2F6B1|nr:hypothetical protein [Glaciihabitans sp. dw_435]
MKRTDHTTPVTTDPPRMSPRRRVITIGLSAAAIITAAALALDTLPSGTNGAIAAPDASQTSARAASTLPPLEVGLPTATPTGLPPTPPVAPLLTAVPRTGSAKGKFVDGFPPVLRTILAGATVVSSSVASEGNIVQAGVVGTMPVSADSAIKVVKAALFRLRFSSVVTQPSATTTSVVFRTKKQDTVTLAITPTGKSSISFTIHAVLRTAKK